MHLVPMKVLQTALKLNMNKVEKMNCFIFLVKICNKEELEDHQPLLKVLKKGVK